MILTHLVLLNFFSGASAGEAAEEEAQPRPGAGRGSKGKAKRRRYELPNGLHVYATAAEAADLASEFLGKAETVIVDKKKKKLVIPEVNVVLDDGEMTYIRATKQKTPNSADAFIAATQQAALDAIAFENIQASLRRRRRMMKAILLLS